MNLPYPCCCDSSDCDNCDADVPATLDVGVSITDSLCSDCTALDGTYTIDYGYSYSVASEALVEQQCSWAAIFDISTAGVQMRPVISCFDADDFIVEARYNNAGNPDSFLVVLRLRSGSSHVSASYQDTSWGGDCCNWVSKSISHFSSATSDCAWSSAIVDVTSGTC